MAHYVDNKELVAMTFGSEEAILRKLGFTLPPPSNGRHTTCPLCGRKETGGHAAPFRWSMSSGRGGKFTAWCGSTIMRSAADCLLHTGIYSNWADVKKALMEALGLDHGITEADRRRHAAKREEQKAVAALMARRKSEMQLDDALRRSMDVMYDAIGTDGVGIDRKGCNSMDVKEDAAVLLLDALLRAYPRTMTNYAEFLRTPAADIIEISILTEDKIYRRQHDEQHSKETSS